MVQSNVQEYKQLAQRIGLIGITNFIISLNYLIYLPILTKNLPINEYGIWVQITVTIGLIPSIITLGLPYAMVRFLAAEKTIEEIQEDFYSIAVVASISGLGISILIFLFSGPLGSILFGNNTLIVQILSIIVFFECLNSLIINIFRTFQQIKKYCILIFAKTYIEVFIVSCFIIFQLGITGAVTGVLLTEIIIFCIMGSLVFSEIKIILPKFTNIKKYLTFGLPTIPGNLSGWIVSASDRYIIGILLGTSFVGYYNPGYILGNTISMLIAPVSFLLPAALSKHHDENNPLLVKTILNFSLKYFLIIAIPSLFGLSLLAMPILSILTNPDIASHSYAITPFVAMSAIIFGIYVIFMQIFVLFQKTTFIAKIWSIAAIINIVFNLLLVGYFGIMGAAIGTLISFIFVLSLVYYYSKKFIIINNQSGIIIKSIVSACAMSIMIILLNPNDLIGIIVTVSLSGFIYVISLIGLKGITKDEIYFFIGLVKI